LLCPCSKTSRAASPVAEDVEDEPEEASNPTAKEEDSLKDGGEDMMKEENEDVFPSGETPLLKNEERSGPLRSGKQRSDPVRSGALRSRPSAIARRDKDQENEDLPIVKVRKGKRIFYLYSVQD